MFQHNIIYKLLHSRIAGVVGVIVFSYLVYTNRLLREDCQQMGSEGGIKRLNSVMKNFRDKGEEMFRKIYFKMIIKDSSRVSQIIDLELEKITEEEAIKLFYQIVAFPLQGVCR